jgi:hypothetical protein
MRIILRSRETGDVVLEQEHAAQKYGDTPGIVKLGDEYYLRAGVADNRVTYISTPVEVLQAEAVNDE